MDADERAAWLELAWTPYVGPGSFLRLWRHFGSARAVLAADTGQIKPLLAKPQALKHWRSAEARQAAAAALAWEAAHADARLLLLADDDYPPLLGEAADPPPVLCLRGDAAWLNHPALAVVGSRHATPQAVRIARDFACALSEAGVVVVSGMAGGIDTAAHEGALRGRSGTVAVWGTGIDTVYPRRNRDLAHRIVAHGCAVSEFPLGSPPLAMHFPRRNRIIAGLCHGTLVVEAALESGSLITARLAAEMGREVFAVPGSIDNPHSKGCHALIKQGAKLTEALADIRQECPSLFASSDGLPESAARQATQTPLALQENSVLQQMGYAAVHPDDLAAALGMSAADVYAELMELELAGAVAALSGGRYQRLA